MGSGLVAVEVVRETVVKDRGRERQPRGTEWVGLLEQLAHQLDDGWVYDRDLAVRTALRLVIESSATRWSSAGEAPANARVRLW